MTGGRSVSRSLVYQTPPSLRASVLSFSNNAAKLGCHKHTRQTLAAKCSATRTRYSPPYKVGSVGGDGKSWAHGDISDARGHPVAPLFVAHVGL
jgi:hypothetical protein